MSRLNRGHSLEVLPDLHPTEVDHLSTFVEANQVCMRLGTLRRGRVPCTGDIRGPWDVHEQNTVVPTIVYDDGRPLNYQAVNQYRLNPCLYYKNVYPWTPEPPRVHIPALGHYGGLGKPPTRQHYKLTPKKVASERVMPSYEILKTYDKNALCHYFKHAV